MFCDNIKKYIHNLEYIGLLQEIQDRGLLWQSCLSKAHGYEFLDPEKCKEKNLDPDMHVNLNNYHFSILIII